MKAFLEYFFGAGSQQEFAIFTPAHIIPILLAIGIIFLIFWKRNALAQYKHETGLRYIMAFVLIIAEFSYYWRLVANPELVEGAIQNLPIAVCGWVTIFGSFMLIGKSQSLFDIIYFWLFSGSIFAVITPTVLTYTGPTRFRYYQFWVAHLAGYVAVFYMIFVHKMRPNIKSAVKSYIALAVLAVVAHIANSMIPGANYLFIARPEAAPSILDILPPNFLLRLLVMASAVTLLYALSYLPWYIKDKKAKK